MAIQFPCPACGQPIEIDSEWGGKTVECPYCRKTVTAPRGSTYHPAPETPVAYPAARTIGFEAISEAPAVPQHLQPTERNLVAVWALVFSLSCLACYITGIVILAPHADELEPFAEMRDEGKSVSEMSQAFTEHWQGALPGWMVGAVLVMLMAFMLWLAGVGCAIIGLRRKPRKKFAIAALAVSAIVTLPTLATYVAGATA